MRTSFGWKAKAGMVHCVPGYAGKTMTSLDNACYTGEALVRGATSNVRTFSFTLLRNNHFVGDGSIMLSGKDVCLSVILSVCLSCYTNCGDDDNKFASTNHVRVVSYFAVFEAAGLFLSSPLTADLGWNKSLAVAGMPPERLYGRIRQRQPRNCANNASPTFDALNEGIPSSYRVHIW